MKLLVALLALIVIAPLSHAAPAWGKLQWGMTRDEVEALYPGCTWEDRDPTDVVAMRSVIPGLEVAGLPFEASCAYMNGKLSSVTLYLMASATPIDPDKEGEIARMLELKYGPPVKNENEPGKLRVLEWHSPDLSVKLIHIVRLSSPGNFSIVYQNPKSVEEL